MFKSLGIKIIGIRETLIEEGKRKKINQTEEDILVSLELERLREQKMMIRELIDLKEFVIRIQDDHTDCLEELFQARKKEAKNG